MKDSKDALAGASDTFLGRTQPELLATPGGTPAADTADLARGSTVGRYVILEVLGKGGMGCVYAAYDPDLDRKIALKLVRPDFSAAAPEEARKRLLREAQSMARLNHPNVITVHDVGTTTDGVFVAMEMIKGDTLRGWLTDSGYPARLPRGSAAFDAGERPPASGRLRGEPDSRQATQMFLLAGEGLAAAHRAGLVHRDFKPENVLVGDDGRVCVTDFGLARTEGERLLLTVPPGAIKIESMKPLTMPGAVMGTPAYMAPEQLDGKPTDGRCDQFAFAVALYEALYGERPYAGGDLAQLRQAMLEGKVRPPPAGSKVPAWLRRPLLRALEVDPSKRFPTMDELLLQLRADPKLKQRKWTYAVAAAVVLIAGAVGARAAYQREQHRCLSKGDLANVWGDQRKAQARAAFLATGLPYAEQAFKEASGNLDGLAGRWSKLSIELCESERLSSKATRTSHAEEQQCLDARAEELSALGELFTQADAAIVDHAVVATARLSEPGACAPVSRPAGASNAADTAALRRSYTRAVVLANAGKNHEATPMFEEVLAGARKASDKKLEGLTLFKLGFIYDMRGDAQAAERTFHEAALAAEAAHDDVTAARARQERFQELGFRLSRIEEAEASRREAQAALDRVGDDQDLLANMLGRESALFDLEGKHAEAIADARRELQIVTALKGEGHYDVLAAEGDLGSVLINAGQYDEARTRLKHVYEGYTRILGPLHPSTQVQLNNLALAQYYAGDLESARMNFALGLAQAEQTRGVNDRTLTLQMCNLGEVLQVMNRHAEARPLYERALKLLNGPGEKDPVEIAEAEAGLARSFLAEGQPQKAVPLLESALKERRNRLGERANLANNELQLATALWDAKLDRTRAKSLANEALKVWSEGGDADQKEVDKVKAWLSAHR